MRYLILVSLIALSTIGTAANFTPGLHAVKSPRYKTLRLLRARKIEKPINTGEPTCPDELLYFAQTLIGTPYHFASANPGYGFDCSGFVGYVFKNFDIDVPRSSRDMAGAGTKVKLADALPGDIILFTGTSKKSRKIGHVGIILCNEDGDIKFIHSTSGKENGVTITTMDKNYKRRFVQIVRVFKPVSPTAPAE